MFNSKLKTQNSKLTTAFTIVELLVAMTLVVILVVLSSVIFAAAINAHRTADSTMEITRRAGVIAEQLKSDVRGLRKDAPLAIWFENVGFDTTDDGEIDTYRRFDQILFFANGDFQTIKQYDSTGDGQPDKTVWGNVSRIQYGHAWQVDMSTNSYVSGYRPGVEIPPGNELPQSRLLARRAHVLTSDTDLQVFPDPMQFEDTFVPARNNRLEYDTLSVAQWKNVLQFPDNSNHFIWTSFSNQPDETTGRPMIDMSQIETLHLLLSKQVSDFKVQMAYRQEDVVGGSFEGVRWWPSINPAGDGSVPSDFAVAGGNSLGLFFEMSDVTVLGWDMAADYGFVEDFYPRALKFTFTIHDEKGLFPDGRTFTQIVTID